MKYIFSFLLSLCCLSIYPQSWTHVGTLTPPSDFNPIHFGRTFAIHGGQVIIGDFETYSNSINSSGGAAFVYAENADGVWAFKQTILPSRPFPVGNFGRSVALEGETLVIGAPATNYNSTDTYVPGQKIVYIYELDDKGMWQESQQIEKWQVEGNRFGKSLFLNSDDLLLNEDLNSDLFRKQSSGQWTKSEVEVRDMSGSSGERERSIAAIEGNYALEVDHSVPLGVGKIYIYEETCPHLWENIQHVEFSLPPGMGSWEITGDFVGEYLFLPLSKAEDIPGFQTGKVYVFKRNEDGSWSQVQVLEEPELNYKGRFGRAVAADYRLLAIQSSIFIHIYEISNNGEWVHQTAIRKPQGAGQTFAWNLALDGRTLLASDSRKTHVFTFDGENEEPIHEDLVEINIFPNPVEEVLNIHVDSPDPLTSMQISNSMGQVVLHEDVSGNSLRCRKMLRGLPGVYLLSLQFESGKRRTQKVLKK
ncbi:MAG: T9SS type A sorting domain-containing protein [Bacteroidota bacterium]